MKPEFEPRVQLQSPLQVEEVLGDIRDRMRELIGHGVPVVFERFANGNLSFQFGPLIEPPSPAIRRHRGCVSHFNAAAGFGFIAPRDEGRELFVDISDIEIVRELRENFDVTFELGRHHRAVRVRRE